MDSASLRTILFGVVLAILVVPFGGDATVPALLIIAALVILDLWWQRRRKGAVSTGVPRPTGIEIEGRTAPPQQVVAAAGFCPHCGTSHDGLARFCTKCGWLLATTDSTPTSSTEKYAGRLRWRSSEGRARCARRPTAPQHLDGHRLHARLTERHPGPEPGCHDDGQWRPVRHNRRPVHRSWHIQVRLGGHRWQCAGERHTHGVLVDQAHG